MEDVLIVTVVFVFAFLAFKLFLDYLRDRRKLSSDAGGSGSLTTSELRLLVQEAVEDALDSRLGPLEKRLEKFEEPRLIPAGRREESKMEHPPSPPVAGDRDATR